MQAKTALGDGRAALARGHVDDALASFTTAERDLHRARAGAGLPLSVLNPVPLLGSPTRAVRDTTAAGLHAVAAGRALVRAEDAFPLRGHQPLEGSNLAPLHQGALDARAPLETARRALTVAKAEMRGPAGASLPPLSGPARSALPVLDDTTRQLDTVRRGLDLLAGLTSPAADARILILSQDTLEARATGGFIGTFGVIHFAHGTVALERYSAAGQLSTPNPPMPVPANLAYWLRSPWELSNVNWWPDFPTTAAFAREMFRREGGGEVAGVVAITQELLGPLIAATGPVDVPGYATVTASGLEQRIIDEVELKEPEDKPKHKFLDLLSQQILDRLLHLPPAKVGDIASVLSRAAGTGDIQAWFLDPAEQEAVNGTTWQGALPRTDGDFLMIADSNMWKSKANKDLVRDVHYTVDRGKDGAFVGHVHAVYSNNGPPQPVVNPTYLGYVRLYVPEGARLVGNQKGIQDEGRAPDGPYHVFSAVVRADPKAQATLDVRYTLPASVARGGEYDLMWVRQVGASADHLTANVLGTSKIADPSARVLDMHTDLNPRGLRGWLHSRWFFRRLGL